MSAALREYVMAVTESAYGTTTLTPVTWTQSTAYGLSHADAYYCRLDAGNRSTTRGRPTRVTVPYGGGFAVDAYDVSDKTVVSGRLSMILPVKQAPFWLSWAGVRISGSGTAPWAISEPDGDLPSATLYHGIVSYDGSVRRKKYTGCKVDAWNFSISETSTIGTLTLDITGSKEVGNSFDASADPDGTEFPPPTEANFPIDPFVYIHAGGSSFFTFGGGVRTKFTELTIASNNVLAKRFYANRWNQIARFMGRKTTLATKLTYELSPDDRLHYETLASETASLQLSDGTHGFTMDLKATNILDPLEDDLNLGDLYMQTVTSKNLWDPSAHADVAITFQ